MFRQTYMNLLSRKDKKNLLIIVLISLVHNFIVFPAQAATNNSNVMLNDSVTINKVIIKKPNSQNNHLEQLKSNKIVSTLTTINTFKLIKADKKSFNKDFKIASIDNTEENTGQTLINGVKRSVTLTAYNSLPSQTDSDPCTTANGFNLCNNKTGDTIAANFLPFGSKVMIPDLFGEKVFVVRDRMSPRFSNRVDVWMDGRQEALNFGVRHSNIIILPN